MLDSELRNKNLYGIKTNKSGPTITHVIYADDIVLFPKASRKDVGTISRILEKYSLGSGQLVNRNKSRIHFSKHTQSHTKNHQKHPSSQGPKKRCCLSRSPIPIVKRSLKGLYLPSAQT